MSELKMLTHIGYHPNIVNLMGACTGSGTKANQRQAEKQNKCEQPIKNRLKNHQSSYSYSLAMKKLQLK